jgi:molybdenum cofactor cytidylyltransferase
MKFGPVPVDDGIGGILAHAVRREGLVIKKGERVTGDHAAALKSAGVDEIIIARLEPGDIGEDAAALRLAEAVAGEHVRVETPFTGRSNLYAQANGVLTLDVATIDRINGIDERITLATLPNFRTIVEGEMIATVKIIPFAVPGARLDEAVRAAAKKPLQVAPFSALRVGVVSTLLPGLKPSVIEKTLRILDTRLAPAHARIVAERRVPHTAAALAAALRDIERDCDLIVVFGASAITDRRDVIPAAIEAAGGTIEHFGMPVDPGNLLLLARLPDGRPVLGAPGCARSPKENGFDWVLHRLLAGVSVQGADIRRMGVGGLLMEIVSRPQPRAGSQAEVEQRDSAEVDE